MPSAAVLGPVVLPLVAALVVAVFGLVGLNIGRIAAALGAWGSAAALVAVWLPVRSSVELLLGQLGYGSSFDMRIDSVSFVFGLMIVVPAALLLTLQPRTSSEAAVSLLAVASAMAAVEAGGVVLTAIAGFVRGYPRTGCWVKTNPFSFHLHADHQSYWILSESHRVIAVIEWQLSCSITSRAEAAAPG